MFQILEESLLAVYFKKLTADQVMETKSYLTVKTIYNYDAFKYDFWKIVFFY